MDCGIEETKAWTVHKLIIRVVVVLSSWCEHSCEGDIGTVDCCELHLVIVSGGYLHRRIGRDI